MGRREEDAGSGPVAYLPIVGAPRFPAASTKLQAKHLRSIGTPTQTRRLPCPPPSPGSQRATPGVWRRDSAPPRGCTCRSAAWKPPPRGGSLRIVTGWALREQPFDSELEAAPSAPDDRPSEAPGAS